MVSGILDARLMTGPEVIAERPGVNGVGKIPEIPIDLAGRPYSNRISDRRFDLSHLAGQTLL
jgi:hypothetical protein